MPKNIQTTTQLHSSHTLAKQCSKFSNPGFNRTLTMKFQMVKLDLERQRNQRSNANICWIIKKASEFQKTIYFCFIDYAKAFDCVLLLTAKSLQSCPTLCHPIDGSPPGSPIPGILQARTLEWVAISFSNA